LAARLFPRVRPARLIVAGCLAVMVATVWLAMRLDREQAYLTTFLPGWLLIGVGVGLAMPNLVAAATATLPPEQTATGSGVVTMSRQIGIAVGVSVLVSIIGTAPTDPGSVRAAWVFVAVTAAAAALVVETTARPRDTTVRDASVQSRA
jgi:MFS family permease